MILLQDFVEEPAKIARIANEFGIADFSLRFAINIISAIFIIIFIHHRLYKKGEYVFTYFMFNIMIFFLTFILQSVKISMGAAFGMFAVFSMIRYRTEDITHKDMTYLFIVIAVGLISATNPGELWHVMVYNGIIILITFLLESNIIMRRENAQNILFEDIKMIQPEKNDELIAVLKSRTGLNIHRVSLSKIDFLKDTVMVRVYYYD